MRDVIRAIREFYKRHGAGKTTHLCLGILQLIRLSGSTRRTDFALVYADKDLGRVCCVPLFFAPAETLPRQAAAKSCGNAE